MKNRLLGARVTLNYSSDKLMHYVTHSVNRWWRRYLHVITIGVHRKHQCSLAPNVHQLRERFLCVCALLLLAMLQVNAHTTTLLAIQPIVFAQSSEAWYNAIGLGKVAYVSIHSIEHKLSNLTF